MSTAIDWMGGAVPPPWDVFKLKHVLREERKEIGSDAPAGAISFGEVVFKNFDNDETLATYRTVKPGQFLINPLNLNYDLKSLRIALSEIECRVSPAYIIASNDESVAQAKYLRWALRVFDVQHIKTLGAGVRQTVKFEDIGECRIALPSLEEQSIIATHLDRATTRIDTLVAKKARFIELLREKRQALITHAVTKGLDAGAPMKDSGIEWLGKVPAHWTTPKLRHIATVQTGLALGKNLSGPDIISAPYLRVANVQDGYLKLEDVATVNILRSDLARYRLQANDVLMNEGGDNDKLGRGHIWRDEIANCVHQNHVFAVRPHGVSSEWLNAYKGSLAAQSFFTYRSKQTTNLASISSNNLLDLPVPRPPEEEQGRILEHLDRATSRIDTLIAKTERSIELLREHRTALITAAVTGKIDLRETT